MGEGNRGGWWPVMAAAVAVGIPLLLVACGGSGSSPGAAGDTAYQKALRYTGCMRSHGEPGFPDPLSNGGFSMTPGQGHFNGALMGSANRHCLHLLPRIGPLTQAQQRQNEAQGLKFTACIRTHGIPNMPDPGVDSTGVHFHPPVSLNSAVWQSAMHACRKSLPKFWSESGA